MYYVLSSGYTNEVAPENGKVKGYPRGRLETHLKDCDDAFDLDIVKTKHLGRHHGRFTLPSALGCPKSGDCELAPLFFF